MASQTLFTWLFARFTDLYRIGDGINIVTIGGVSVSLNNFLLVLAVMSIVLGALLNFAKVHSADIAQHGYSVATKKGRSSIRANAKKDK